MNKEEKAAAFKFKQDWIETVMADARASHATRIYAFGVYKHMFGVKDESFPGAKSIKEATGLNDGKFYKYNDWLEEHGYLDIDRKGVTGSGSNNYRLALPTPCGGNHLPPVEVALPPVEVTPTPSGGTKTTRKTTINTTSKTTTDEPVCADAPTVSFNRVDLGKDRYLYTFKDAVTSSNEASTEPVYFVDLMGVTKSPAVAPEVLSQETKPVDEVEAKKGKQYLELLLKKNVFNESAKQLARQRYADAEYEPSIPMGVKRAGWVVIQLDRQPVGAGRP